MLTDRIIEELQYKAFTKQKRIGKADGKNNLFARFEINGVVNFSFIYKTKNFKREKTLGSYPQMSLQEARELAKNIAYTLKLGVLTKNNTFDYTISGIYTLWYESASSRKTVPALDYYDHLAKKYLINVFGHRLFKNLTPNICFYAWAQLEKKQEFKILHALCRLVKKLYIFATDKEYVQVSDMEDLTQLRAYYSTQYKRYKQYSELELKVQSLHQLLGLVFTHLSHKEEILDWLKFSLYSLLPVNYCKRLKSSQIDFEQKCIYVDVIKGSETDPRHVAYLARKALEKENSSYKESSLNLKQELTFNKLNGFNFSQNSTFNAQAIPSNFDSLSYDEQIALKVGYNLDSPNVNVDPQAEFLQEDDLEPTITLKIPITAQMQDLLWRYQPSKEGENFFEQLFSKTRIEPNNNLMFLFQEPGLMEFQSQKSLSRLCKLWIRENNISSVRALTCMVPLARDRNIRSDEIELTNIQRDIMNKWCNFIDLQFDKVWQDFSNHTLNIESNDFAQYAQYPEELSFDFLSNLDSVEA